MSDRTPGPPQGPNGAEAGAVLQAQFDEIFQMAFQALNWPEYPAAWRMRNQQDIPLDGGAVMNLSRYRNAEGEEGYEIRLSLRHGRRPCTIRLIQEGGRRSITVHALEDGLDLANPSTNLGTHVHLRLDDEPAKSGDFWKIMHQLIRHEPTRRSSNPPVLNLLMRELNALYEAGHFSVYLLDWLNQILKSYRDDPIPEEILNDLSRFAAESGLNPENVPRLRAFLLREGHGNILDSEIFSAYLNEAKAAQEFASDPAIENIREDTRRGATLAMAPPPTLDDFILDAGSSWGEQDLSQIGTTDRDEQVYQQRETLRINFKNLFEAARAEMDWPPIPEFKGRYVRNKKEIKWAESDSGQMIALTLKRARLGSSQAHYRESMSLILTHPDGKRSKLFMGYFVHEKTGAVSGRGLILIPKKGPKISLNLGDRPASDGDFSRILQRLDACKSANRIGGENVISIFRSTTSTGSDWDLFTTGGDRDPEEKSSPPDGVDPNVRGEIQEGFEDVTMDTEAGDEELYEIDSKIDKIMLKLYELMSQRQLSWGLLVTIADELSGIETDEKLDMALQRILKNIDVEDEHTDLKPANVEAFTALLHREMPNGILTPIGRSRILTAAVAHSK